MSWIAAGNSVPWNPSNNLTACALRRSLVCEYCLTISSVFQPPSSWSVRSSTPSPKREAHVWRRSCGVFRVFGHKFPASHHSRNRLAASSKRMSCFFRRIPAFKKLAAFLGGQLRGYRAGKIFSEFGDKPVSVNLTIQIPDAPVLVESITAPCHVVLLSGSVPASTDSILLG